MRIYAGLFLSIVLILWASYRLFVKKDLKKHLVPLSAYSSFVVIWAIIYACMIYS